jgi:tRNA threonylcarbamoyladenosine modification (KEOPS) complex  Pcc1 subunit
MNIRSFINLAVDNKFICNSVIYESIKLEVNMKTQYYILSNIAMNLNTDHIFANINRNISETIDFNNNIKYGQQALKVLKNV